VRDIERRALENCAAIPSCGRVGGVERSEPEWTSPELTERLDAELTQARFALITLVRTDRSSKRCINCWLGSSATSVDPSFPGAPPIDYMELPWMQLFPVCALAVHYGRMTFPRKHSSPVRGDRILPVTVIRPLKRRRTSSAARDCCSRDALQIATGALANRLREHGYRVGRVMSAAGFQIYGRRT